jgi:FkbM family methyltransferase
MNTVCYSGGVGKDITFETEIAEKYNCEVYLFDPSPTGIETAKNNQKKNLKFYPIGLAGNDGVINFSTPDDMNEGSYRVPIESSNILQFECKKLSNIMKSNNHYLVELVKLDIEGFEYEVVKDLMNSNLKINQICLEYHHFFKNISILKTIKSILLLRKNGYILHHKIGMDYSFVHKSYFNK